MYHWIVNMRLQAILECFVHDTIRSQNKSKLWTTIALSKFELQKRSKAQNVANWTGYQKFMLQFHIQISKFWQVRNLRLPFHLFVCLSVCNVDDTDRTVKSINTKLGTHIYIGSGYMCIVFGVDDITDYVIRSTNRSNFEIVIALSIF